MLTLAFTFEKKELFFILLSFLFSINMIIEL